MNMNMLWIFSTQTSTVSWITTSQHSRSTRYTSFRRRYSEPVTWLVQNPSVFPISHLTGTSEQNQTTKL